MLARRKNRALTQDVVTMGRRPERVAPKWRKFFRRLTELRDSLLDHRGTLAQEANDERPEFSSHMADAGTDNYDRDFALGMLSSEQDAVYEIDEALNRIREGTYGICQLTGRKIPLARLEAIPWTRFTAEAEKELEREGVAHRTRLGPRETIARIEARDADEDEE